MSIDSTLSEMQCSSSGSYSDVFKVGSTDGHVSDPFACGSSHDSTVGELSIDLGWRTGSPLGHVGGDSTASGGLHITRGASNSYFAPPRLRRSESAEIERERTGISFFTSRFQRRANTWRNVRNVISVLRVMQGPNMQGIAEAACEETSGDSHGDTTVTKPATHSPDVKVAVSPRDQQGLQITSDVQPLVPPGLPRSDSPNDDSPPSQPGTDAVTHSVVVSGGGIRSRAPRLAVGVPILHATAIGACLLVLLAIGALLVL